MLGSNYTENQKTTYVGVKNFWIIKLITSTTTGGRKLCDNRRRILWAHGVGVSLRSRPCSPKCCRLQQAVRPKMFWGTHTLRRSSSTHMCHWTVKFAVQIEAVVELSSDICGVVVSREEHVRSNKTRASTSISYGWLEPAPAMEEELLLQSFFVQWC